MVNMEIQYITQLIILVNYLLPNLPSDLTFEIFTLPSSQTSRRNSSSSPGVINDTVITTTTATVITGDDSGNAADNILSGGNCDNDDIDDDDNECGDNHGVESSVPTNGSYIKSERVVERVSGIHFLTRDHEDEDRNPDLLVPKSETTSDTEPEVRKQLLEYLIQNDGSVICKWCGEVLPSRTRWYRHKYKLHVSTQVTQPAPLFKCHSCNAYFKSRKGYIGHLSSRHSDNDNNENDENREEQINKKSRRTSDIGKGPDWEQQREKEEKLVADIIDRVKRECEAQGETVTRRGYSRRTTVMNS
ncbi:uncharacterized protein LOC103576864 [Microplitis demolitor]|uniref:uncharacterized protein LOC103576864 n=1 Tax=Microplitis demolitor TaxID=69319 RepID=UPI0006D529BE|nr:uncharacterized protein LOC103576864 [Microplitis demolitor]